MSTEYRRGIPSTAHVEAATRLGLEWRRKSHSRGDFLTRFRYVDGQPYSNWATYPELNDYLTPASSDEHTYSYRPIRPDGAPVDWEALDQEVARVGQQGQPLIGRDADGSQFAINTDGSRSPLPAQPQDFRGDLWTRISRHFSLVFRSHNQVSSLTEISSIDDVGIHSSNWQWGWGTADREAPTRQNRTDILARWTVHQELKPLYDLVDGAQGEVAMPEDVTEAWHRESGAYNAGAGWLLRRRNGNLEAVASNAVVASRVGIGSTWASRSSAFAVLDAVAERRVAERMRGQTQAPTVTAAQSEQHRHNWIYDGLGGGHNGQYNHNCACGERDWFAEPMSAPSPREAVVRPRVVDQQTLRQQLAELPQAVRAERAADEARQLQMEARLQSGPLAQPAQPEPRRFADVRPDRHGWRWWRAFSSQGPRIECRSDRRFRWVDGSNWVSWDLRGVLDDWLRHTVIPTDEQGNPVSWEAAGFAAEAMRPAQESVQRAASDATPARSVGDIQETPAGIQPPAPAQSVTVPASTPSRFALIEIDDADPTAERIRQEQEAERQRLAGLRQQLAAERAAQPTEKPTTASRFDLIEPDPQADPTASIRAWEARQAAAKVRPAAVPARPTAAPRRPAIEVVDAEVDGLSRVEVVTALVGRAFNGGC